MNIVTVKINGMEYNLKGEENEEYLHKVAAYVDRKVRNITNNNKKLSSTAGAVLTAINVVDEMFKCNVAYSELMIELEAMKENEKLLQDEIKNLKNSVQELEGYKAELKDTIESMGVSEVTKAKEEAERLSKEIAVIQESSQKYRNENIVLKKDNKELKFQLQSSKYKIIALQNKIIENQINIAKAMKLSNPLLKTEK
jgi:cell division protein ZapA